MTRRRIVLTAENLSSNSTGRVYCLWLLAKELGYDVSVISERSNGFWYPLRGTEFERDCSLVTEGRLAYAIENADAVISCKPLPESFGNVLDVPHGSRPPLGVDVDDPDLEHRIPFSNPAKLVAKAFLKPRLSAQFRRLRRHAISLPSIVSNPWLQDIYGGRIIPHVRVDIGNGSPHLTDQPHVAFIGSNRPHKGVPTLRAAIGALSAEGFRLTITDKAPADAEPWENWVGNTSLAEGAALLRSCDITVIVSDDHPEARGQLPAKLMDAMLAGRGIVVGEVPAAPWGVGAGGLVVPPGDAAALVSALRRLADPRIRQQFGDTARDIATSNYTVEANTEAFEAFCEEVIAVDR